MSRRALSVVALVLAGTVLHAGSVLAKTVYVNVNAGTTTKGTGSCLTPNFTSIQSAVSSADPSPSNGASRTIVMVCPGTYAEQLVIDRPVVVKGVIYGDAGLARIIVPNVGLAVEKNVAMAISGVVAAQVMVHDTWGVSLTNLTIDGLKPDGTPAVCASDVGATRSAGVAFYNTSDITSVLTEAGATSVVVSSQGRTGCPQADGILSENSYLTIQSNSLHDLFGTAVNQVGGYTKILSNYINNCDLNGISVANALGSFVTSNVLSGTSQSGVRVLGGLNVAVSSNTLGPWVATGVEVLNSLNALVSLNRIDSTWTGISLTGSAASDVLQNTIVRAPGIGILVYDSTSIPDENAISNNTINESPIGIFRYRSLADVITPNTFNNVAKTVYQVN